MDHVKEFEKTIEDLNKTIEKIKQRLNGDSYATNRERILRPSK